MLKAPYQYFFCAQSGGQKAMVASGTAIENNAGAVIEEQLPGAAKSNNSGVFKNFSVGVPSAIPIINIFCVPGDAP